MEGRNTEREGWNADELGEQSSYEDTTEIKRRLRRGDETVGDADARDVAGDAPAGETPETREDQDTLRQSPEESTTRAPTNARPRETENPVAEESEQKERS